MGLNGLPRVVFSPLEADDGIGGRSCGRGCDFVLGEDLASWSGMEELGRLGRCPFCFLTSTGLNHGADIGVMAHRIRTSQLVMGGEEEWFEARRSCA